MDGAYIPSLNGVPCLVRGFRLEAKFLILPGVEERSH